MQLFLDGHLPHSAGKYVGEFRDHNANGQGIEYRADGRIFLSGRWENEQLVQWLALDTNRFPFYAPVADADKAERDRLAEEAKRKTREAAEESLPNVCAPTRLRAYNSSPPRRVGQYPI